MSNYSYSINYGGIIISLITIAELYYINKKCNNKGWYAIIPFYNKYLLFKYAKCAKYYFITLISGIVAVISAIISFYLISLRSIMMLDYVFEQNIPIEYIGEPTLLQKILYSKNFYYIFFVLLAILIISIIIWFYFDFKKCKKLASVFGCEKGYEWGLFFIPIVFLGIIAWDQNYQYLPNQPIQQVDEVIYNPPVNK